MSRATSHSSGASRVSSGTVQARVTAGICLFIRVLEVRKGFVDNLPRSLSTLGSALLATLDP